MAGPMSVLIWYTKMGWVYPPPQKKGGGTLLNGELLLHF